MKNKKLYPLSVILSLCMSSLYSPAYGGQFNDNQKGSWKQSFISLEETEEITETLEQISSFEEESLIFMREEEKLARDVYLNSFDLWNFRAFDNVAKSEQEHTEQIKALLDKYAISDPVVEDIPGVYVNQELQELYDTLSERSSKSLAEALLVGCLIEEKDMVDIKEAMEGIDNSDILQTYQNLLDGSINHLQGFVNALRRLGIEYEPVILEQDYFDYYIN